jgi:hypothetical protein
MCPAVRLDRPNALLAASRAMTTLARAVQNQRVDGGRHEMDSLYTIESCRMPFRVGDAWHR